MSTNIPQNSCNINLILTITITLTLTPTLTVSDKCIGRLLHVVAVLPQGPYHLVAGEAHEDQGLDVGLADGAGRCQGG